VALAALTAMMGVSGQDPDQAATGLIVSYLDTTAVDSDGNPVSPSVYPGGVDCADVSPARELSDIAQGLVTEANLAKLKLVMVEACWKSSPRSVGSVIFPGQMSSYFISLVKKSEEE
jgi:hypothetical protein